MNKRTKNHLVWIYTRLIKVHNEDPNIDYMTKLKSIILEPHINPAPEASELDRIALRLIPKGKFIDRNTIEGAYNGAQKILDYRSELNHEKRT